MDKKENATVIRKHFHNVVNALDKSQTKGVFTLGQSAFIFQSLQKLSEFIDIHDKDEPNAQPKQAGPVGRVPVTTTSQQLSTPSQNVFDTNKVPNLGKETIQI